MFAECAETAARHVCHYKIEPALETRLEHRRIREHGMHIVRLHAGGVLLHQLYPVGMDLRLRDVIFRA